MSPVCFFFFVEEQQASCSKYATAIMFDITLNSFKCQFFGIQRRPHESAVIATKWADVAVIFSQDVHDPWIPPAVTPVPSSLFPSRLLLPNNSLN